MTPADRRLHPATALSVVVRRAPGLAVATLPGGFAVGRDGMVALQIAAAAVALAFVWSAVAAWRVRWGVGASELVIETGVFGRTRRVIPFARIADVELERSLVARLIGLAKLRIETGGGGRDEARLDSLGFAEARTVQAELRAARGGTAMAEAPGAGETALYAMTPGRIAVEGLLTPSLVVLGAGFWLGDRLGWGEAGELIRTARAELTTRAIAALVAAAVPLGLVTGVLMAFRRHHRFTLTRTERGLRVRRGLFTLVDLAIPAGRVQALVRRDGPIRRGLGWSRLEAQTIGGFGARGGRLALAPLARAAEAAAIAAVVHPVAEPASYRRVSRRTGVRAAVRTVGLVVPIAVAGIVAWPPALVVAAAIALAGTVVAARRWRVHGYALAQGTLHLRLGVLSREHWTLPIANAQAFALIAGPLQRALGLASVAMDSAGAPGRFRPRVVDLPLAEAEALLAALRAWRPARSPWS